MTWPPAGPVALLAQTTLSHDEWRGVSDAVKERFSDVWTPGRSDLCFATTNRQTALKAVAADADAVVVIGSANSSNTIALEKVARAAGCPRVVRVDGPEEVPDDLYGTVAVTAGASAPEALIDAVVSRLDPISPPEEVVVIDEEEYFPPPRELRELVRAVTTALTFSLGAPVQEGAAGPLADDRALTASAALDAIGQ